MEHVKKFKDDPIHNLIPGLLVLFHLIIGAYVILTKRDVTTHGNSCYGYGRVFGKTEAFDGQVKVQSDLEALRQHGVIVEP